MTSPQRGHDLRQIRRVRVSDVFSKSLEEVKNDLERALIHAALVRAKGNAPPSPGNCASAGRLLTRALKNYDKAR